MLKNVLQNYETNECTIQLKDFYIEVKEDDTTMIIEVFDYKEAYPMLTLRVD